MFIYHYLIEDRERRWTRLLTLSRLAASEALICTEIRSPAMNMSIRSRAMCSGNKKGADVMIPACSTISAFLIENNIRMVKEGQMPQS